MEEYFVYVLKSYKNGKKYTGCSSKSPEQRLKEHNQGTNKWTRGNRPFQLIYSEKYANKTDALKRERFLKSGYGRRWLKECGHH